ncbi:unnamed protein product [Fusarium venenatum]|uniref:Uncharacterized protein n=1 Tax=Fusarium venenatum TaxID=56646 RepID=A0A2L2SPZ5_9HYPO|nr:uncharacterized protein FVRRES_11601 [Fusarium venenatum]CEI38910.1 unnamed protein product [Fusarium venenatum]
MHATPVAASQVEDEASPLLTCVAAIPSLPPDELQILGSTPPSSIQPSIANHQPRSYVESYSVLIGRLPTIFRILSYCVYPLFETGDSDSVIDSAISRFLAKKHSIVWSLYAAIPSLNCMTAVSTPNHCQQARYEMPSLPIVQTFP